MMTKTELKASVMFMLRTLAEAALEGQRPDVAVSVSASRLSRKVRGWEAAEQAEAVAQLAKAEASEEAWADVYEAQVRRIMTAEWNDLRANGMVRLQLATRNRHVPAELRAWARRQLVKAVKQHNPWAVAYAVLSLREAAAWEMAHAEDESLDAMMTASFGDARATGEFDGGPISDDRQVHTVGGSFRFRAEQ